MEVKLPSLRGLNAFEATARLGSMTAAAEATGTSQPVVSQRIRALEEHLGLSLFERSGNSLVLTPHGERFYHEVEHGLQVIHGACQEMYRLSGVYRPQVSIAAGSGFTHLCLLPLLPELKACFPQLRIHLVPVDRDDDASMQAADIAIRFGRQSAASGSQLLAEERVLPVCTPAYAERHGLQYINDADDLSRLTLLHQDERDPRWLDWKQWARAVAIWPIPDEDIFPFHNYPLVLNAALEGQGIALGWKFIVEKHLASGKLMGVGPEVARAHYGYWIELKYPDNALVQPVKDWLVSALNAERE